MQKQDLTKVPRKQLLVIISDLQNLNEERQTAMKTLTERIEHLKEEITRLSGFDEGQKMHIKKLHSERSYVEAQRDRLISALCNMAEHMQ